MSKRVIYKPYMLVVFVNVVLYVFLILLYLLGHTIVTSCGHTCNPILLHFMSAGYSV